MYSSVISVDWCPSLRPPVMCLTLSRDRTGATSPKLAEMKPMVRVTRDPIQSSNSKGQRSRSPGRLTPRTKISHIYGMGMPTNFKLGTRMEYNDPHHRRVRWPPRWNLLVVVQSHRACMGRGHIVWRPRYTGRSACIETAEAIIKLSFSAWQLHRSGFWAHAASENSKENPLSRIVKYTPVECSKRFGIQLAVLETVQDRPVVTMDH